MESASITSGLSAFRRLVTFELAVPSTLARESRARMLFVVVVVVFCFFKGGGGATRAGVGDRVVSARATGGKRVVAARAAVRKLVLLV